MAFRVRRSRGAWEPGWLTSFNSTGTSTPSAPECPDESAGGARRGNVARAGLKRPLGVDELQTQALTAVAAGETVAHAGKAAEILIAAGDARHLEVFGRVLDAQSRAA